MKNLQIKITITDGEHEAKTLISVENYLNIKDLHGISMLDEQGSLLLNEIHQ